MKISAILVAIYSIPWQSGMRRFIKAICKIFKSGQRRKRRSKHDRSRTTSWKLMNSNSELTEKLPSKVKLRKRRRHCNKNVSCSNIQSEQSAPSIEYPPPHVQLKGNLRSAGYSSIIEAAAHLKTNHEHFIQHHESKEKRLLINKESSERPIKFSNEILALDKSSMSNDVPQKSSGTSALAQLSEEFERVFGKKPKGNYSDATTAAVTIEEMSEHDVDTSENIETDNANQDYFNSYIS